MNTLNILIPTDLSRESEHALVMAVKLSEKLPVKIHLLHVIQAHELSRQNHGVKVEETIEPGSETTEYFRNLRETVENFEFHIKSGSIAGQIQLTAAEIQADLVIAGTAVNNNFIKTLPAADPFSLSAFYQAPILRIREQATDITLKNILLIADFEYFGKGMQINNIKRVAEAFNGTIHLTQIIKPSDERYIDQIEAQMKFFASEHQFERFEIHLYREGSANIQTLNYLAEMDLFCIRTDEGKGIETLLYGSLADRLINLSGKPLLTFKLKRFA